MVAERVEVRLDAEHRRRLTAIAAARGISISITVRGLIDQAYEEALRADRRDAALAIGTFEIEDVPDPQTLSGQLAGTYDTPNIP